MGLSRTQPHDRKTTFQNVPFFFFKKTCGNKNTHLDKQRRTDAAAEWQVDEAVFSMNTLGIKTQDLSEEHRLTANGGALRAHNPLW